MHAQITSGVKISVDVVYQPEYSNPAKMHFMFSYQITIENQSDATIQLINRHWDIFDSIGEIKQVEGEGVIGEQPVLTPGALHQYVSACPLTSQIGYIEGYYEMMTETDGSIFHAAIARVNLIASFKLGYAFQTFVNWL